MRSHIWGLEAFSIQSKYIIVDAKLLEYCPGDVFDCFTKDTFDAEGHATQLRMEPACGLAVSFLLPLIVGVFDVESLITLEVLEVLGQVP
jgi:hypothetical protein